MTGADNPRRQMVAPIVAGLLVLAILILVPPSAAEAATFFVNSAADAEDINPGNGKCVAGILTGFRCTLRAAIMEANALSGGPHTIRIAPSTDVSTVATYILSRDGSGDNNGARGDLDIVRNVTIHGFGGDVRIQTASGFGDRIFSVGAGVSATFEGLTLQRGAGSNPADGQGGGVMLIKAGATVTLSNLLIEDNHFSGLVGGVIENLGTLAIDHSTLRFNEDPGGLGGSVFNLGSLTITDSSIINGTAAYGGAIYNQGTLTMLRSTMRNNDVTESGGGVYNDVGGTATLIDTTFAFNTAADGGGGIFSAGTLTVDRTTVANNDAAIGGGGIYSVGPLTIRNGTISDNGVSSGFGGGVFTAATALINNATVFRNNATVGGGIYNDARAAFNFSNTILAGNFGSDFGSDCAGSVLTSGDFNLIETTAGCSIGGNTSHNITGENPLLGPLQDNGGFVHTQALLPGSPALEAGNPTRRVAFDCEAVDARGVSRPQDANLDSVALCDIGAVEASLVGAFTVTPTEATVEAGDVLLLALRWTTPGGWHELDTLQLRIVDDEHTIFSLLWDEQQNTFRLATDKHDRFGREGRPGAHGHLESELGRLILDQSRVEGSGPTGPHVTLTLALSFKAKAADHNQKTYRIEVAASNDFGVEEPFAGAGTLTVVRKHR